MQSWKKRLGSLKEDFTNGKGHKRVGRWFRERQFNDFLGLFWNSPMHWKAFIFGPISQSLHVTIEGVYRVAEKIGDSLLLEKNNTKTMTKKQ